MTNNEKRAADLVKELVEGSVNGIHSEDAETLAEEITEALNVARAEGYREGAEKMREDALELIKAHDDLLTRNAELEAWNAQFRAGCDGKCALYECVC